MFKDIRFPTAVRYGATSGPMFKTDIIELDSGHEQRNENWSAARITFDFSLITKTDQVRKDLLAFVRIVRGMALSFRVKDWSDYQVETGEGVLAALGNSQFQLYKRYTYGSKTADRLISLPLSVVLKNGSTTLTVSVDYTLNSLTGVVTMLGSPTITPTSWTGEFDVPCRFTADGVRWIIEDQGVRMSEGLDMIECRPEDEEA